MIAFNLKVCLERRRTPTRRPQTTAPPRCLSTMTATRRSSTTSGTSTRGPSSSSRWRVAWSSLTTTATTSSAMSRVSISQLKLSVRIQKRTPVSARVLDAFVDDGGKWNPRSGLELYEQRTQMIRTAAAFQYLVDSVDTLKDVALSIQNDCGYSQAFVFVPQKYLRIITNSSGFTDTIEPCGSRQRVWLCVQGDLTRGGLAQSDYSIRWLIVDSSLETSTPSSSERDGGPTTTSFRETSQESSKRIATSTTPAEATKTSSSSSSPSGIVLALASSVLMLY